MTYPNSRALEREYAFASKIGIRESLKKFAEWYKNFI
jgi:UDP-glucuronate 4-epimerase